jgi:hypothetical protein
MPSRVLALVGPDELDLDETRCAEMEACGHLINLPEEPNYLIEIDPTTGDPLPRAWYCVRCGTSLIEIDGVRLYDAELVERVARQLDADVFEREQERLNPGPEEDEDPFDRLRRQLQR